MFSKYLLAPAVVALGSLLAAPDAVLAQHGHGGGGRGGGGGHVSAYHGGGAYRGGYHGGYGYGGRGYGYGGYGRGYGYGGWGYGYYPWWGGGYYWGGGPYYYGANYDGDTYVYPNYTTYVQPDTTYVQPDTRNTQPADNSAGIRVIVPDANARVWFDGNATTQTGTDRLFHTPPLAAASSYRIRATWTQNGREVTQERTVPVAAGRLSLADFTRPQSEGLPTPTTAK